MFESMKNNDISIKNLAAVLITSFVLGLGYNYFRADGLPWIRDKVELKAAKNINNNVKNNSNKSSNFSPHLINLSQAYALFNQNAATFVDARDKWEYGDGHIKNAVNIPEYKFEPSDTSKLNTNKDELIVIYCGGNDCDVSKRLAVELSELGYQRIFVFEGGWDEWKKASYPVSEDKQ